jgi:alpha-beta hydrolase superfamily lysophospholipase
LNSKQIPLFIAGESYGGCLTILASKYFQDYPNEKPINYDSCLLIAPAIEGELPPFPILQLLRYVLAPIAPKWIPFFMPNTVSPNKIWKDQKILDYYTSPQKLNMKLDAIGKPFRLGTAVQLLQALEECRSNCISNYNQAFCIVHGSNDVAVPVSGSQLLYDNCITLENDKELHIIDGSYHGILAEPEAEIAMKYIIDYVDKRMNKFNNSPK